MRVDRGFKAKFRYRTDEFLGAGAGRQLGFLLVLTIAVAVLYAGIGAAMQLDEEQLGPGLWDKIWYYFTRMLDAGTMGGDTGGWNRIVSTGATMMGVVIAGLLISSLSGNFQDRLDAIKRGGSAVVESGHFLVLGWSEKIYSVIDQLAEAYVDEGQITCVVMAEGDKIEMEEKLRDKLVHQDRVKLVVRSGSAVSLDDLSRVAIDEARAAIVLIDETSVENPTRADGRVIKTLLAIFNHPDVKKTGRHIPVTCEVMLAESQEIARIASNGRAEVIKTNEIISKVILQTARISGLSLVYDELLRFEGNEIHFKKFDGIAGKRFGDLLLDFPNGCVVGTATAEGHTLNPSADHILGEGEELLILAEDSNIDHRPKGTAGVPAGDAPVSAPSAKPVEHMLILGWNEKIFPILQEYDNYVGPGSTLTLVNQVPEDEREKQITAQIPTRQVTLRHIIGDFTSRHLMDEVRPERYPTVMVLGDSPDGTAEGADTRAIIALLLLRDRRQKNQVKSQEVCSEILDPKNRELAATTEIDDIVISNEMVSMVLAQITYEPRVRSVLEDLFQSDGSEIYLKDLSLYVQPGVTTTFEQLILAAKRRGELAMGIQLRAEGGEKHGLTLNPPDRSKPITPQPGDRLVVLAEDDG